MRPLRVPGCSHSLDCRRHLVEWRCAGGVKKKPGSGPGTVLAPRGARHGWRGGRASGHLNPRSLASSLMWPPQRGCHSLRIRALLPLLSFHGHRHGSLRARRSPIRRTDAAQRPAGAGRAAGPRCTRRRNGAPPGRLATAGDQPAGKDRPDEARQAFVQLTRLQPGEPAHWLNLGNASLDCGDAERAHAAFLRASGVPLLLGLGPAHMGADVCCRRRPCCHRHGGRSRRRQTRVLPGPNAWPDWSALARSLPASCVSVRPCWPRGSGGHWPGCSPRPVRARALALYRQVLDEAPQAVEPRFAAGAAAGAPQLGRAG